MSHFQARMEAGRPNPLLRKVSISKLVLENHGGGKEGVKGRGSLGEKKITSSTSLGGKKKERQCSKGAAGLRFE